MQTVCAARQKFSKTIGINKAVQAVRIKTLIRYLKEVSYLRSVLIRYGDSLAQGKYCLFDNFRSMSLATSPQKEKAEVYFGKASGSKRGSITKFLNRINYYQNKNKKSTEEYTALYSANNYNKQREVKLFSFENKKILTICIDAQETENQLEQYRSFRKAYPMPTVIKSNRYPNALEISMVKKKEFPGDAVALNSILEATQAYASFDEDCNITTAQKLTAFSYENPRINELLTSLKSMIRKDALTMEFPLCVQHGDLSKENLIFGEADGETAFWWIDWEHARKRMFLYDFFFYILNSAMYYDRKAYDCYISGKSDTVLETFFSHFGLVYDSQRKYDYFLIFAVEFLKERVCDLGRIAALEAYCKLIEELLVSE